MDKTRLEMFWDEIPIGKENAVNYDYLKLLWGKDERAVRQVLHELSAFDNGDDYILVRSSRGNGFYRTDDQATLKAYRQECLNKGRSVFAPVKKINRVLQNNDYQFSIENNLRVVRNECGMTLDAVCALMRPFDKAVDKAMLSKFENGVCLPTPFQLRELARIYRCEPSELVDASIIPIFP